MDRYARFADAVHRVSQLHPHFLTVVETAGDGWAEIDVSDRGGATVEGLRVLLRNLKAVAQKDGISLVLNSSDFGDFDLAEHGFEHWIDDRVVYRSNPAWSCKLEETPNFSFEKIDDFSSNVIGKTGSAAFTELAHDVMNEESWPDRGIAFDRLRMAIQRQGQYGLDGIMEDLGIAPQGRGFIGI